MNHRELMESLNKMAEGVREIRLQQEARKQLVDALIEVNKKLREQIATPKPRTRSPKRNRSTHPLDNPHGLRVIKGGKAATE